MNYDLSQIETRGLRLCGACKAEPREYDIFCRRCGARLDASGATQSAGAASSSSYATSSLSQSIYHRASGRLVAAVVTDISHHIAPLHNRLSQRLISTLLSIPIWLIIMLLSPLDAYAMAKAISKQVEPHDLKSLAEISSSDQSRSSVFSSKNPY
jgi:predicted amidophosphoribosyltransferase